MTGSITAAAAAVALLVVPAAGTLRPAPALKVPSGFTAELYASGLERPTALAFGPGGMLYVAQEGGEIVAAGRGSVRPRVLARGFRTPLGLVWSGSTLFVAAQGSLHRLEVRDREVVSRRAILVRLPFGRHQQDTVALGPDGRLYLGSGSTCDVCRERDRRSGAILSLKPNGDDLQVVARGLRNPFGLAFESRTGRLYASDNGRDDLGKSEPAETIVLIRRGANYGWPNCWASWRERRLTGSCRGVTPPVAYLEPHSSANSLSFWRNGLFVAEWGQYLSRRWGRKLVRVDVRSGRATTFATGFDHPLGLTVEPGGAGLLAGDWRRGVIYRITKR